jgi:hypothetical protein
VRQFAAGRRQRPGRSRWRSSSAASEPELVPPDDLLVPVDVARQLALIRQLDELRQVGALTDTGFKAKKAKILATRPRR